MVNGSKKGSKAALDVMKLFNTALGGGFSKTKHWQPGKDIDAPDYFDFAIECKHVKYILTKHLAFPNKYLKPYWAQARRQAKEEEKKPLLICKIEGVWWVICKIPDSDLQYPLIEVEILGDQVAATLLDGWLKTYKRRLNEYRRENNSTENF